MSRSFRLLTFGCLCSILVLALLSTQPTPISAEAPATPTIGDLLSAETITIQDDWKGLSPAAIVAHYTLKRSECSAVKTLDRKTVKVKETNCPRQQPRIQLA